MRIVSLATLAALVSSSFAAPNPIAESSNAVVSGGSYHNVRSTVNTHVTDHGFQGPSSKRSPALLRRQTVVDAQNQLNTEIAQINQEYQNRLLEARRAGSDTPQAIAIKQQAQADKEAKFAAARKKFEEATKAAQLASLRRRTLPTPQDSEKTLKFRKSQLDKEFDDFLSSHNSGSIDDLNAIVQKQNEYQQKLTQINEDFRKAVQEAQAAGLNRRGTVVDAQNQLNTEIAQINQEYQNRLLEARRAGSDTPQAIAIKQQAQADKEVKYANAKARFEAATKAAQLASLRRRATPEEVDARLKQQIDQLDREFDAFVKSHNSGSPADQAAVAQESARHQQRLVQLNEQFKADALAAQAAQANQPDDDAGETNQDSQSTQPIQSIQPAQPNQTSPSGSGNTPEAVDQRLKDQIAQLDREFDAFVKSHNSGSPADQAAVAQEAARHQQRLVQLNEQFKADALAAQAAQANNNPNRRRSGTVVDAQNELNAEHPRIDKEFQDKIIEANRLGPNTPEGKALREQAIAAHKASNNAIVNNFQSDTKAAQTGGQFWRRATPEEVDARLKQQIAQLDKEFDNFVKAHSSGSPADQEAVARESARHQQKVVELNEKFKVDALAAQAAQANSQGNLRRRATVEQAQQELNAATAVLNEKFQRQILEVSKLGANTPEGRALQQKAVADHKAGYDAAIKKFKEDTKVAQQNNLGTDH
ncbi:hypothetical protein H4219_006292 [Mycoemilia scoparia]|uniref:Uncharacterized protein n=1 Tax=Mycoemilia scoparia TaxID=417184 RepID=A0A9W7ZIM7_9FUNG|nr:hypothetical protein H4219_006292 [Mycoemilia scoparia]